MNADNKSISQGTEDHEDAAVQAFGTLSAKVEAIGADGNRAAAMLESLVLESRKIAQSMATLAKSPALQMTPAAFATEMQAARNDGYKSGKTAAAEEAKAARARDIQANEALLEQRVSLWRLGFAWGALVLAVLIGRVAPTGRR